MPSEAITERRDDPVLPGGRKPMLENAPSVMRDDEPKVARFAGMWGLMFLVLGVAAIFLTLFKINNLLGYFWGTLCAELGLILMLFHAASDKDEQLRRGYGGLGAIFAVGGFILTWITYHGVPGGLFPLGLGGLALGLLFVLAFLRHETDDFLRDVSIKLLGIMGVALALIGLVGGNIDNDFLMYRGLLLAAVGLAYVTAFLALRGTDDTVSYWLGLGLGAVGLATVLVALGRGLLPGWFYDWGWRNDEPVRYMMPYGALLLATGCAYLGVFALVCSDSPLATVTRRELGAFFYSPIIFMVLLGITVMAWLSFTFLISAAVPDEFGQSGMLPEPIVRRFMWPWALLTIIFLVPALTMRLFSEEKRNGTLEVLLTAPVSEFTVVMGKFLAGLVFFMLTWAPWTLFLMALRVGASDHFDELPFVANLVAWLFMGAAFVSMGLFFSSLTQNQIVSFILAAAGMMLFVGIMILHDTIQRGEPNSFWVPVLNHMDFNGFWLAVLQGTLMPRYLLFYLSMAVFWLFLTVKVLEARKWS